MAESSIAAGQSPQDESFEEPPVGQGAREEAAMPYTPGGAGEAGQPSIEAVLARQERALMAIDGVVGVAVGRTPAGDDAIVVYLRDAAARRHVPARLEGYPVETEVTGDIDAYRAPGSGR